MPFINDLKRIRLRFAACLMAMLCLAMTRGGQAAEPAAPWLVGSVAERIRDLRSITYYPFPAFWNEFDPVPYEKALDGMQAIGANTVWLIIPWYEFQSQALPEAQWIPGALENLQHAVSLAEKRGMNVILPLSYLGLGWAPEGIDAKVWTVDPVMYQAFETYVLQLVAALEIHRNILYLLYTEDCNPYTDFLRDNPITINAFREWCRASNPDVGHWNQRWETEFTWESLLPMPKRGSARLQRVDYWRWTASILRERHGGLARKIKHTTQGHALIGYHDFRIIPDDSGDGDTPIPDATTYDFLSTSRYYTYDWKGGPRAFKRSIHDVLEKCRVRHPGLPLAMLECGTATYEVGFGMQAEIIDMLAGAAQREKIGINLWMWQDFLGEANTLSECSFGLITPAGNRKPAYFALEKRWK